MTTEVSAHLIALQSGRWFAQLPPDFAAALLRMGRIRQLTVGQSLFLRGDPPCGLYAVLRGALTVSGTGGVGNHKKGRLGREKRGRNRDYKGCGQR